MKTKLQSVALLFIAVILRCYSAVSNSSKFTIPFDASRLPNYPRIVSALNESQPDAEAILKLASLCPPPRGYLLSQAAMLGNFTLVKAFGKEIKFLNVNSSQALRQAAALGHSDIVRYLLDPNRDFSNLAVAIEEDRNDIASGLARVASNGLLVAADARALKSEALILSAMKGHAECVGLLLMYGADIHTKGDSVIITAAKANSIATVLVLLRYEANVLEFLQQAFIVAIKNRNYEMYKLFIAHGCNPKVDNSVAVKVAAENNATNILIDVCSIVFPAEDAHHVAFQQAAAFGGIATIKELHLTNKISENIYRKALALATSYEHVDVVIFILNNVDVKLVSILIALKNIKNVNNSPIFNALEKKREEIANSGMNASKFLLKSTLKSIAEEPLDDEMVKNCIASGPSSATYSEFKCGTSNVAKNAYIGKKATLTENNKQSNNNCKNSKAPEIIKCKENDSKSIEENDVDFVVIEEKNFSK